MAHILPESPPLSLPTETLRVYRALKELPDSWFIWHHLAPWQPNSPDFLLLNETGRVLLLKVSSSPASQVTPAAQFLLLESERVQLGLPEARVLAEFTHKIQLPEEIACTLETLVIFPNIPNEQVQSARLKRSEGEPAWAGRKLLHSETLSGWDEYFPAKKMDPLWLEKIRQLFSPEVLVPAALTVRLPAERRLAAGLTGYLLDYNQESAVKADLELPLESSSLVDDSQLNIINGVAGSGKTLILLYRLRLLYHLYPKKRFLVLTHNRPLWHDMQARFHRLEGSLPENIEWQTFNSWCYHHRLRTSAWVEPLSQKKRLQLAQQIVDNHLGGLALSAQMFLGELDWLKDQSPLDLQAYLSADRRGRGFGLNSDQRNRVFAAFEAYQQQLLAGGSLDWGDVPQRLSQALNNGSLKIPEYDIILVDEAQFFAPLWVQIIQKILNPRNGHLFMVADPTQGFLGRGASWKSLGLQARGRTHLLRHSYRTTREIMQFASLLYRLRLSQENDADILTPDLLNMPSGAFPEIICLTSPQDEITRLANEVAEYVRAGYPRRNLLLLHSNANGVKALIQAIDDRLGKGAALDAKITYPGDYVRVTTLNAGAGLESQIVFLAGLREMFDGEGSLRLSDDERESLMRDNTKKLYMAATRAGQRLVLTFVGTPPEVLNLAIAGAS